MLSEKEKKELEALQKDESVRLAVKTLAKKVDVEKKKLYQYRWLKKQGEKIAKQIEDELC